jgi:hypothetical protein
MATYESKGGKEGNCVIALCVVLLLLFLIIRGCRGGCSRNEETEPKKHSRGWFHIETQKDIIEDFATEEQPQAWNLYRRLEASIEVQEARVASLRKDFKKMGRKPEKDEGYMRLSRQLEELKASHNAIFETLKTGYLEKKKFEAQPDSVEVQEWKRSLSECMNDSEIILRRFEDLQLEK